MQPADLIARAASESGLQPRGESFHDALERFAESFNRSATLNAAGRAAGERMAVDALIARFAIEDWAVRHPEVLLAPVQRPVFILGLPRAGTTLLLNLLALDPQHRVYWNWESNRETPPAESVHLRDDPRIARKVAEINAALANGMLDHRLHVELGDEPAECVWLLGQDFKSYAQLIVTPVPEYFSWLYGRADMAAAYRYHKRALQVLQSRAPGQWILKHPAHAPFVDALLAIYPDARIVMTHRDPAKPLGSSCSSSHYLTAQWNDGLVSRYVGRETLEIITASLQQMCSFAGRHPRVPVHHLHYQNFATDAFSEILRLYAFLGETLRPEVEREMRAALSKHFQRRREIGAHRYKLADYGLSAKSLPRIFAEYVEQFTIAREPS